MLGRKLNPNSLVIKDLNGRIINVIEDEDKFF